MSDNSKAPRPMYPEWVFFVIGLFFFFTLVGAISALTPTLYNDFQAFVLNFHLATVPNTNGLMLPAPTSPGVHTNIYTAGEIFCIAWGFFAIVGLVLRTIAHSPTWRRAENISGMFWWFGASYLISTFLTASTTLSAWFAFWAAIIMLIGGSLIIRGLVIAAFR